MSKKIIHIITGDGKGKTTASLGMALRAIGADKKVKIIQFMKTDNFSEHAAIKKYKLPIDVETFGIGFYKILGDKHTTSEHKISCSKALEAAKKAIDSEVYDLIILDEINVALGFNLIKTKNVLDILKPNVHLQGVREVIDIVLTGRNAPEEIKKIADLVSEIKCIRHYFDKGLEARKGIEF